ncbi:MAG: sensor histidine kinase [Terrimicrobiaceae bacterium]
MNQLARIPDLAGSLLSRGSLFWKANLLFWGAYGLMAFLTRLSMGQEWMQALTFTLVFEGCALGLSLLLRMLYRRTGYEFGLRAALLVNLASLAAAILQGALAAGFSLATGWHNPMIDFFMNITLRLLVMWFTFCIWSLGYYWLQTDAERLNEIELKESARREALRIELQMLRAQLDPHFLFNSLNAIAAEIRSHPTAASAMILELSDYLRYSLEHRNNASGRLSEEIDAMRAYLKIQQARFGDRLDFSVDVDEAAAHRAVPGFLLQPLVENAVKHSLQCTADVIEIRIVARSGSEDLLIEVTNTGRLQPPSPAASSGLGLDTLRRRLELHYPGRNSFTLEDAEGWVRATLRLKGEPCCA